VKAHSSRLRKIDPSPTIRLWSCGGGRTRGLCALGDHLLKVRNVSIGQSATRGLIKGERGLVHILDRETLIQVANGSYGLAEKEYERLFGRPQH